MDRYNRPIKATWWQTHGSGQKFVESDLDYDLVGNADAVLMDAQANLPRSRGGRWHRV